MPKTTGDTTDRALLDEVMGLIRRGEFSRLDANLAESATLLRSPAAALLPKATKARETHETCGGPKPPAPKSNMPTPGVCSTCGCTDDVRAGRWATQRA